MTRSTLTIAQSVVKQLKDETKVFLDRIENFELRITHEEREPECHCYCVGDQADASDCPLHGRTNVQTNE